MGIRLSLTILPAAMVGIACLAGGLSPAGIPQWLRSCGWSGAGYAVGMYLLLQPAGDRDLVVTDRGTLVRWQLLTGALHLYAFLCISLLTFAGIQELTKTLLLCAIGGCFSCYPWIWRTGKLFRPGCWWLIFGAWLLVRWGPACGN